MKIMALLFLIIMVKKFLYEALAQSKLLRITAIVTDQNGLS